MSLVFRIVVCMSCIGVSHFKYTPTEVGSDVTLLCSDSPVRRFPAWTGPISWTEPREVYNYNGNPKFLDRLGSKGSRLAWAPDNTSLIVEAVEREDTGMYECGSVAHMVEVRVAAEPPVIADVISGKGRSDITAIQDQKTQLVCTSRGGYPAVMVEWKASVTDAGAYVQTNVSMDSNDNTYVVMATYTFTPSREDDKKTFTCQSAFSTPPLLLESTKARLYLKLKPTQPVVSSIGSPIEGQYNIQVAICETKGFRPGTPLTLVWWYNGITRTGSVAPESDGTMYRISDTYNFTSVIGRQDDGRQIRCSVSHPTLPQALTGSTTLHVQYRPSLAIENGPVINVEWSHNVTLQCIAVSRPQSTLTWSMIDGDRLAVGGANNTMKYTLYNVQSGGKYACSASNGIGEPVTVVVEIVVKLPSPFLSSSPESGAIVGGVTAGVGGLVLLFVGLLLWRLCPCRRKTAKEFTNKAHDGRPHGTATDVSESDTPRYESVGYSVPVTATYEDLKRVDNSKSVYDSLRPAEMAVTNSIHIYENENTINYVDMGYEVPIAKDVNIYVELYANT